MTDNQSITATEAFNPARQSSSPVLPTDENLPSLPPADLEEIASLEMGKNSQSRKSTPAEHQRTPILGNNLASMENNEAETQDTDSSPSDFLPYRIVAVFAKDVMKDEEFDMEGASESVRKLIEYAQSLEEFIEKIKVADDATVNRLEEHKASGKWNPKWEIQRMGDAILTYNAQHQPNFLSGLPNLTGNTGLIPSAQYGGFPQQFHVEVPTLSQFGPIALPAVPSYGLNTSLMNNFESNTPFHGSEEDGNEVPEKRGRGRPSKSNGSSKSLQPQDQHHTIMNEAEGSGDTPSDVPSSKRGRGRPPKKRTSGTALGINGNQDNGNADTQTAKKQRMEMASSSKTSSGLASQKNATDEVDKPVKRGRGRPRKTLP